MSYLNKIKKFKNIGSSKYKYLVIFLFALTAMFFSLKSVSFADTPVGEAYCYLSQTGITYVCGPNSTYGYTGTPTNANTPGGNTQPYGNVCTVLPIYEVNGKEKQSGCSTTSNAENLFEFTSGECYIEGVNSAGTDVWQAQKDCSSQDFSVIASYGTNMPTDITNTSNDSALVGKCQINSQTCDIVAVYINPIVDFLAAIVGIVVVISIVLGGIQYSASADNPQASAAAKKRIGNALLAAVAFLFLYGFLEFIIPGGFLH